MCRKTLTLSASAATRGHLASAEVVYVSAASIWEIAIKIRLGKVAGDAEAFASAIDASGFRELPVVSKRAAAAAKLPLPHSDPFDRLLPAQAFLEPLRPVRADEALVVYGGATDPSFTVRYRTDGRQPAA
jgi:PIN domain nuclease of toxin-antitoxin system